MGRPVKWRHINRMPSVLQFLPSGENARTNDANTLLIEEYEAIRLKDLEGLEQEACAERMQVSRPTFQRILMTARQKVADSLVNGKRIQIAGGNYTPAVCMVNCLDCDLKWQESIDVITENSFEFICPRCRSSRIVCAQAAFGGMGRGKMSRNRYCQGACRRQAWNERLIKENTEKKEKENT